MFELTELTLPHAEKPAAPSRFCTPAESGLDAQH